MNIERYQVIEQIGSGTIGKVYRARDPLLQQEVALKWLDEPPPAGAANDRFVSEIRQIATLGHPHIVPVYELGQHEGRPFLAMRYLNGGQLDQHLPMTLAVALQRLSPIADALDTAHDHQIFHNHLSPANILLDETGQAYLSDFGLGHLAPTSLPAYQKPEQVTGAAGDQYSLAVILFEAITGRLPFAGRNNPNKPDTMGSPDQTLVSGAEATQVNLNHILPVKVNLALQKAFLPEPSARYDSCLALLKGVYEAAGLEVPAGIIRSGKDQKQLEQSYQDGLAAMSAGRWAEAMAAFNQVSQLDPDYRNVKRLQEVVNESAAQPASPKPLPIAPTHPENIEVAVPPSRRPLWLAAGLLFLAIVAVGFVVIPNLRNRPAGAATVVAIVSPTPKASPTSGPTATLVLGTAGEAATSQPTATEISLPDPLSLTVFQAGPEAKLSKAGQEQALQAGQDLALEADLQLHAGDEPLILLLPDNSKLSLDRDGVVEIREVSEVGVNRLLLVAGRLLVSLNAGQGMVVEIATGDSLKIFNGPAGILLNPDDSWIVDCFSGPCVVTAGQAIKSLRQCQQAEVANGQITVAATQSEPDHYFFSLFAPLSCPLSTAAPTNTPSPTVRSTGSSTPPPISTATAPAGTATPISTTPPNATATQPPPPSPTLPPPSSPTLPPPPSPTLPPPPSPTLPPPPTETRRPPTNTPAPPTNTPELPTATPPPNPTRTPGPTDPPPPTNTPRPTHTPPSYPRPEPTQTPGA